MARNMKEWSDNHREETERQEQEARRTSYATLTNKMHKMEDEEQPANTTKTTLSNLRATLAAKEHPEPYTGTSAPTPITRSKLFSQGSTDTRFGFPEPRVQKSSTRDKPQNNDASRNKDQPFSRRNDGSQSSVSSTKRSTSNPRATSNEFRVIRSPGHPRVTPFEPHPDSSKSFKSSQETEIDSRRHRQYVSHFRINSICHNYTPQS